MARLLGIVAVLLLAVAVAGADEDAELRAAQRELKQARAHLQQADRDYQGHRRTAVEHLDQALREIRLALEAAKDKRAGAQKPETAPGRNDAEED